MMQRYRRRFLSMAPAFLGALAWPGIVRSSSAPPRIVALEWRYADHARSLGIVPVGIADLQVYATQASVNHAVLQAAGTQDMGRRQEPSLESIIQVRPDLILGVHFRHDRIEEKLSRIAQTVLYDYTMTDRGEQTDQLDLMLDELRNLGSLLGLQDRQHAAEAQFMQFLHSREMMLSAAKQSARPIVFALFPAGVNHVRLFTSHSLPVRILSLTGLTNGWSGPSEGFGFTTVGPERLMTLGDVTLIGVAIGNDNSYTRLSRNPVWHSLPFVRSGQLHLLSDNIWPFGGLPAAQIFAETITQSLLSR